jgi:hypothetical protein
MTRDELKKIDKELNLNIEKDKILIKKRGYYLYYNEPNKNEKDIMVHKHDCGFCSWGSGNGRESKKAGRNGVWIGPFETPNQAEYFVDLVIRVDKRSRHTCCNR